MQCSISFLLVLLAALLFDCRTCKWTLVFLRDQLSQAGLTDCAKINNQNPTQTTQLCDFSCSCFGLSAILSNARALPRGKVACPFFVMPLFYCWPHELYKAITSIAVSQKYLQTVFLGQFSAQVQLSLTVFSKCKQKQKMPFHFRSLAQTVL